MNGVVYLLWSNKHGLWWGPNRQGYTEDITRAGRYDLDTAVACVVKSAWCGKRDQVTCMVAAPDNWTRPERDKAAEIAEDARRDELAEAGQR